MVILDFLGLQDAQYSETCDKTIFRILRFLVLDLWSILSVINRVHDVTVQTISVQCKEYMTFILGDVTVRILGRFGTKLEKAVPLRYKHRKMYILMLFLLFLSAITPF